MTPARPTRPKPIPLGPLMAAAIAALGLGACSEPPAADAPPGLSAETRARYETCLERNMAVAMAWEAIEAQCLAEAKGEAELALPEPETATD